MKRANFCGTILAVKKGSVLVQTAVTVFFMMFLFSIIYQYGRLTIIAAGTRDAVRSAVISTVNANCFTAFYGMRDGNSGAYKRDANGVWHDAMDSGTAGQDLITLLGLKSSNGTYKKLDSDGVTSYSISSLEVTMANAAFASNSSKLSAHASYTLSIPVTIFLVKVQTLSFSMTADAQFEQNF
jgi:hypothetical protein